MIIERIHIKNFRSIQDESLSCDSLTALVGRNGAGKSSFLRALEMFYDPSAKATVEDFYDEDTSQDIDIAVSFSDLDAEEKDFFSAYIDGDSLTIVRVFSQVPGSRSGTYHGMRLQNLEFRDVHSAGGKKDTTLKYKELKETDKYSSLPVVRSADAALKAISQWESDHPDECSRLRDEGQFFGFTGVGVGYLGRHTRFIRVPAVRDASDDAEERRGSPITEMMDLVVRSALATRKDVTTFKEKTQEKYKDLLDPSKLTELSDLQSQLTITLKTYVPDASVSLHWAELAEVKIPMPEAEVKLLEDGYEATVQRTGHGLQRAFILTMLQHLVAAREIEKATKEGLSSEEGIQPSDESRLPNLVLAIEEPELYQHPSRQRHMASVLLQLAQGSIPGVTGKTQVIYSTHAPLFVGLDRFDQIRLVRKEMCEIGKPKVTKVAETDLNAVAEEIWTACGQRGAMHTAESLRPRLQAVMTPWVNEGFFADVAVLVEGEGDRAAILGVAKFMGHDFDGSGITVVPCMGKNNLDRPLVIFRRLGIPVYVVWDSDFGETEPNPDTNRYLLRLVGEAEDDWPNAVGDYHACFRTNLEKVLADEIGSDLFTKMLTEVQEQFGIPKTKDALKTPAVLQQIVDRAAEEGKVSGTLKSIVESIAKRVRIKETGTY